MGVELLWLMTAGSVVVAMTKPALVTGPVRMYSDGYPIDR